MRSAHPRRRPHHGTRLIVALLLSIYGDGPLLIRAQSNLLDMNRQAFPQAPVPATGELAQAVRDALSIIPSSLRYLML